MNVEFWELMIGEQLGAGLSRTTYAVRSDGGDRYVLKVQKDGDAYFQNVLEWRAWKAVEGTPSAKYLAPCYEISATGKYLVQARTQPVSERRLPTKLPSFLSDFAVQNFGRYNGRIVAHDYGLIAIDALVKNARKPTLCKPCWYNQSE